MTTITKLYELFAPKLGKEASESLYTYLETKPEIELENNLKHLATKEDLTRLETKLEVGLTKVEVDFANIECRLTKVEVGLANIEGRLTKVEGGLTKLEVNLTKVEGGLFKRIEETKSETIKWMFIFWIGQMLATYGFILLFVKK